MKKLEYIALLSVLLVGFGAGSVQAASTPQSNLGCQEVLERWAVDPESVSSQRADECKGIKGIIAADDEIPEVVPFAGAAAAAQAADPCAGPNAGGSVHCWGPWSALAPAAGAAIDPPVLIPAEEYDVRPELAEQFDPDVSHCEFGQPCGFATVVDGSSTEAPADETALAKPKATTRTPSSGPAKPISWNMCIVDLSVLVGSALANHAPPL